MGITNPQPGQIVSNCLISGEIQGWLTTFFSKLPLKRCLYRAMSRTNHLEIMSYRQMYARQKLCAGREICCSAKDLWWQAGILKYLCNQTQQPLPIEPELLPLKYGSATRHCNISTLIHAFKCFIFMDCSALVTQERCFSVPSMEKILLKAHAKNCPSQLRQTSDEDR